MEDDEYVHLGKPDFMTTKLTLSMNKEVVEKVKRIAAKNGKSVSKMVEEYFESLENTQPKNPFAEIRKRLAPHREQILASLPKDKSFKEIVNDWRYEDYLRETGQPKAKPKRIKK